MHGKDTGEFWLLVFGAMRGSGEQTPDTCSVPEKICPEPKIVQILLCYNGYPWQRLPWLQITDMRSPDLQRVFSQCKEMNLISQIMDDNFRIALTTLISTRRIERARSTRQHHAFLSENDFADIRSLVLLLS